MSRVDLVSNPLRSLTGIVHEIFPLTERDPCDLDRPVEHSSWWIPIDSAVSRRLDMRPRRRFFSQRSAYPDDCFAFEERRRTDPTITLA